MAKIQLISNDELDAFSLEEKINFIAKTSQTIVGDPQTQLSNINSLFRLLRDSNFMVIKLTALSLGEVFRDIIPLYSIDKAEIEERLKKMIKKDERKTVTHELELLGFYEKFFQGMDEIKNGLSELNRKQHQEKRTRH